MDNKCNSKFNKKQKTMSEGNILKTIKVINDKSEPLQDVEFIKKNDDGQLERIGLTNEAGQINILENPNTTITVSHVSGEAVQDKLSDLDPVIRFEPNELEEVIINSDKSNLPTLITFGGMLIFGLIGSITNSNKPMKITV